MKAVALLTCEAYPLLSADDRVVQTALQKMGVRCEPMVWTDADAGSSEFSTVVLRSCWDYYLRPDRFAEWITTTSSRGITLWNPAEIVRWNSSKRYLRSLASRGVRVVPTVWIESAEDLQRVPDELRLRNGTIVIKPHASTNASGAIVADYPLTTASEDYVRSLLERGTVLIQPFLREVQEPGEHSLIYLDGQFSHCVLKRPRSGDFRVQEEHGGSTSLTTASDALLGWATDLVELIKPAPLYGRVDAVVTADGPMLMELELIEPSLYLSLCEGSAVRFAGRIRDRL